MLLPLYTDAWPRHFPAANVGILVVTVLMFALQRVVPEVEAALLLRPGEPGLGGVLGSALLHAGWGHLLGNMLFLYIFGNGVNDKLGNTAFLGLYVGGAAAASLLHMALSDSPALGASGAVAAVSGAYLVLYPRSRVVLLLFFVIVTTFAVPAALLVGLFFLLDVVRGLDDSFLGGASGTANWAHVGGTVYGMAVGLALLRMALVRRDRQDALSILSARRDRREARRDRERLGQVHGSAMDVVPQRPEHAALSRVQDLRARINERLDRDDKPGAAEAYRELLAADARQVLARGPQFDVAGQLYREGRHAEAAAAFGRFLEAHGDRPGGDVAQAHLLRGLLLARYLNDPAAARPHLAAAADRLDGEDAAFARGELDRLPPAD